MSSLCLWLGKQKEKQEGESKSWRARLLFRQLVSLASGIKRQQHVKINEMLLLFIYGMLYIFKYILLKKLQGLM